MLVIGVIDYYYKKVQVIHYATFGGNMSGISGQNNQIIEEPKIITEKIEVAVYRDDITMYMYSPTKAISRARTRKGEARYNILSNNCETFINWALIGVNISDQVDDAFLQILLVATIGLTLTTWFNVYNSKDNNRK